MAPSHALFFHEDHYLLNECVLLDDSKKPIEIVPPNLFEANFPIRTR